MVLIKFIIFLSYFGLTYNELTDEQCNDLLKLKGYLPKNTSLIDTFVPKVFTNATADLNSSYCVEKFFGNFSNGTLPFYSLGEFSTPPPTLSPYEIRDNFCKSVDWGKSLDFSYCDRPCDFCMQRILNMTNEYLICKDHMNDTQPFDRFKAEPMSLALYLNKFAEKINKFPYHSCTPFPEYHVFSNLVWKIGQQFRYGNFRVPDYKKKTTMPFQNQRWKNRNDTIEVPYGNLPRGEYSYSVVIYENLINPKISIINTRYKNNWPEKHPIITGEFIDPRVEPDLLFNDTYEINAAIISINVKPAYQYGEEIYPKNPLPGEFVISFTHYNNTYVNPICIYWQPIKSGNPDEITNSGYWSNYGQRVFKTNHSMTVCRSTHLGIFALLMEPYIPPQKEPIDPLNVLNILLTLIAGIIFFVYIFAMFLLRCTKDVYNRVHISLAFSLLLSQMFYLGSWDWRDNWDRCTSLSTCLEFCHVAVMTWIMIEATHQLSRLRYFFNQSTNIESFYHIIGWGFPLTILVALMEFPYEEYTKIRYCWAYVKGFDLWYFVGPLLVLLLVAISLKIITVIEIRKVSEAFALKDINYQRAQRSLLASVAIIPTFSIMWMLSTIAVSSGNKLIEDVSVLAVPILNIAIALEVLYFYFYRNDDVIDSINYEKRLLEKQKLKSYEYMRGLNMRISYKVNDKYLVDEDDYDDELDDYMSAKFQASMLDIKSRIKRDFEEEKE